VPRRQGYEERLAGLERDGWPLIDSFRMSPWVPSSESDRVYRDLMSGLPSGLTLIAIHANKSGDIETMSPAKAHCRTDEYRIFGSKEFREFITGLGIRTVGFRPLRKLLRRNAESKSSA